MSVEKCVCVPIAIGIFIATKTQKHQSSKIHKKYSILQHQIHKYFKFIYSLTTLVKQTFRLLVVLLPGNLIL